jgi:hypothetical protein
VADRDPEIVYRKRGDECPPGLHSFVPIIEGEETTGLVCTSCGRSVREDMTRSDFVITEKGAVVNLVHHRRDPRF